MEIQHAEVLAIIAEVAAAFVGFSLAIGLLQSEQPGADVRRQAMQSVAELAMIGGGGALIVLVIGTFGLSAATTWRAGSVFTLLIWGGTFYNATRRFTGTGKHWSRIEKVRWAGWLSVLGVAIFVLNSIYFTELTPSLYVLGLFVALFSSAYMFLLSTFIVGAGGSAT